MTKEFLASLLTGREYGSEISESEEVQAKKNGLIVIFGYSDDNIELRGAANDEAGCYGGGKFKIDRKGLLPQRDEIDDDDELKDFFKREEGARLITAKFGGDTDCSWTYETDIPNATFEIIEHGEKFCRGIVIDVKDLP